MGDSLLSGLGLNASIITQDNALQTCPQAGGSAFPEAPSPQVTQVCVKLKKGTQCKAHFYSISPDCPSLCLVFFSVLGIWGVGTGQALLRGWLRSFRRQEKQAGFLSLPLHVWQVDRSPSAVLRQFSAVAAVSSLWTPV